MPDIVIVGAGVIGLSTALYICENAKSFDKLNLTIVAKYFPDDSLNETDYTSPWAGAHFRPFPSKNDAELKEYPLTRVTQKIMHKLAREHPESSVQFVTGEEYIEDPPQNYLDLPDSYTSEIEDFEVIDDKAKLSAMKATYGTRYKTWVVNPPLYLNFLFSKLRIQYGVNFKRTTLNSLKQVYSIPEISSGPKPTIINCSGQGLQFNGGYDPKYIPIRGQTVLIRPPLPLEANPNINKTITHQSKDGSWTFCITRPLYGGVIIGGTKQPHDLLRTPRQSDTDELLARAALIFPDYMKVDPKTNRRYFDVFKTNVGFRPAREGGLRIELEELPGGSKVIHAYGTAGSGYELSYGVADKVHGILKTLLSETKL